MVADERFDVVVVPDAAALTTAEDARVRDLAHFAGVPAREVAESLRGGRFVVYRDLTGIEVPAARGRLQALGVVVEVQPAVGFEAPPSESGRFQGPVVDFSDGIGVADFKTGAGAFPAGRASALDESQAAAAGMPPPPQPGLHAMVSHLEAAADSGVSVTTLDGVNDDAFPVTGNEDESAEVQPAEVQPAEVQPAEAQAPDNDARLQLDVPARPASAPEPDSGPETSRPAPTTREPPPDRAQPVSPPPNRGLLLPDAVSNALACMALTMIGGILAAVGATRTSGSRDAVMALEAEIAQSSRKPLAVERGELRPPEAVRADLEGLYGEASSRFLRWFLVSIPVGLVLGRMRR